MTKKWTGEGGGMTGQGGGGGRDDKESDRRGKQDERPEGAGVTKEGGQERAAG